jgi:hypothetical protein
MIIPINNINYSKLNSGMEELKTDHDDVNQPIISVNYGTTADRHA